MPKERLIRQLQSLITKRQPEVLQSTQIDIDAEVERIIRDVHDPKNNTPEALSVVDNDAKMIAKLVWSLRNFESDPGLALQLAKSRRLSAELGISPWFLQYTDYITAVITAKTEKDKPKQQSLIARLHGAYPIEAVIEFVAQYFDFPVDLAAIHTDLQTKEFTLVPLSSKVSLVLNKAGRAPNVYYVGIYPGNHSEEVNNELDIPRAILTEYIQTHTSEAPFIWSTYTFVDKGDRTPINKFLKEKTPDEKERARIRTAIWQIVQTPIEAFKYHDPEKIQFIPSGIVCSQTSNICWQMRPVPTMIGLQYQIVCWGRGTEEKDLRPSLFSLPL